MNRGYLRRNMSPAVCKNKKSKNMLSAAEPEPLGEESFLWKP
jgi:hypothetical protein